MERNPEHRMEIQDDACGKTHIMLSLKPIKSAKLFQTGRSDGHENDTCVLKELCQPWSFVE